MNKTHNALSEFIKNKLDKNIKPHIYFLKNGGYISSDIRQDISKVSEAIESYFDIGDLLKSVNGANNDEKAIEVTFLIYKEKNRLLSKRIAELTR